MWRRASSSCLKGAAAPAAGRAATVGLCVVLPSGSAGVELSSVPWPDTVDLDLQREAEEDPNHDDAAEHRDAFEGGIDDDRPDDVSHDQHLQAEQDAAAQITAQSGIGLLKGVGSPGA